MSGARIGTLVTVVIILLALVGLFFLLRPPLTESIDGEKVQEETVAVAIKEGSMSPWQVTVYEGDQVNLQITSDRPVEFHLPGYNLTEEVEPEEPAELSFEAANTGRFAIEDHNADAEIGALLVVPR